MLDFFAREAAGFLVTGARFFLGLAFGFVARFEAFFTAFFTDFFTDFFLAVFRFGDFVGIGGALDVPLSGFHTSSSTAVPLVSASVFDSLVSGACSGAGSLSTVFAVVWVAKSVTVERLSSLLNGRFIVGQII